MNSVAIITSMLVYQYTQNVVSTVTSEMSVPFGFEMAFGDASKLSYDSEIKLNVELQLILNQVGDHFTFDHDRCACTICLRDMFQN